MNGAKLGWQKIKFQKKNKSLAHIVISMDRLVYLGNCWKQSTIQVSYPHALQVYKLSIHFLQHYH